MWEILARVLVAGTSGLIFGFLLHLKRAAWVGRWPGWNLVLGGVGVVCLSSALSVAGFLPRSGAAGHIISFYAMTLGMPLGYGLAALGILRWIRPSTIQAPSGAVAARNLLQALQGGEAWLRMATTQMPSVLWTADRNLLVTFIAGAAQDHMAIDPEKVLGSSLHTLFDTASFGQWPMEAHKRALEGESISYEESINGRHFQIRIEPLREINGSIIGCVALALDTTERKQTEEALQQARSDLEKRVKHSTAELVKTNERLHREIEQHEKTEADLRRSEERYRGLVESQRELIARVDIEGRFTFVNDAAVEALGRPSHELLGTYFHLFAHPDDLAALIDMVKGLSQSPHRAQMELRGQTVSGWRWFEIESYAVRDTNGQVIEIQTVGRDITQRREAEAAEKEQRVLADALRDTAAVLSSTLNLEEVLERILSNLGKVVPHDAANIMLVEEGIARIERAQGYSGKELREAVFATQFAVSEVKGFRQMAATGQPLIIPDTALFPEWVKLNTIQWQQSYAGAPIMFEGELLGFLNLDSRTPNAFTDTNTERLLAFANQAAIAIRNARLHQQAQALAAVTAAIEERQRLARDLHDAVSQALFSASVIAQSLPRLWNTNPAGVRYGLDELAHLTGSALAEMRTMLLELRPADLADARLDDLLSQLTIAASNKTRAEISLEVEGSEQLPPDVRIAFYRIAQEALNNVVKHARASRLSVALLSRPEETRLHIVDDGRGFRPDQIPPGHLGLQIMRERADLIGARLQLITAPSEGTEILVVWPDPDGERKDGS